jgi:hypothetical protein
MFISRQHEEMKAQRKAELDRIENLNRFLERIPQTQGVEFLIEELENRMEFIKKRMEIEVGNQTLVCSRASQLIELEYIYKLIFRFYKKS